jgi:protein-S-isoprenylcysteine O-methyltransferase Ste14
MEKKYTGDYKALKKKIIIRFSMFPLFMALLVLLPAGTLTFWPVYLYCLVLIVPMVYTIRYFLRNDPVFLEKRTRSKEQETQQKTVVIVFSILFLSGFSISGFDHRFGWSSVPAYLIIVANFLVLLGYLLVIRVFMENSYASRVVEIQEDQKVISTGLYGIVRHPMYFGITVMFLATPVALGSYWAIIPFLCLPFILIPRIRNEEKILTERLPGYKEYCEKVRFRMIPFVW